MENLKEKILVEKETIATIKREIEKKIVGQEDMIRKILIGIFTGNHILLEGLPGPVSYTHLTLPTNSRV